MARKSKKYDAREVITPSKTQNIEQPLIIITFQELKTPNFEHQPEGEESWLLTSRQHPT